MIRGSETLLVIDDEDDLREITVRQLRKKGFTVFEAANARQAEETLREPGAAIHLIISDVVMPELSGPKLIAKFKELGILKDTKVLFVSGYSGNKIDAHGVSQESFDFLEKPYMFTVLLEKILSILDRNRGGP